MDPNAYRAELQKLVQERDLSQKDAGRLANSEFPSVLQSLSRCETVFPNIAFGNPGASSNALTAANGVRTEIQSTLTSSVLPPLKMVMTDAKSQAGSLEG